MFYAVTLFRAFTVIPPVHIADEISGNATQAVKGKRFAEIVSQFNLFSAHLDVDVLRFTSVFEARAVNIRVDLFLRTYRLLQLLCMP